MGTVSLARFGVVGGNQVKSAVCRRTTSLFRTSERPGRERITTRIGRYVPGLTQMVSDAGWFGPLVSLMTSTPSKRCRPATSRVPQETAARRVLATVSSDLGARPVPGRVGWNSTGPADTRPQPWAPGGAPPGRPAPAARLAQVRLL